MRRRWRTFVVLVVLAGLSILAGAPAGASPARINGSGSTYVGLAMQQWVADAQTQGLAVNYLPTGSPDGLTSFGNGLTDFAGTEAEYSALVGSRNGGSVGDNRGYQYVPDVAGAIAVMYNADDKAGRKIDYLHLSARTVALIFMGFITRWSDPAITNDNKGLVLPDQPITVVYRGGQSGTTALFYDFVANTAPQEYAQWVARNRLPTDVRIIQLDTVPEFAPKSYSLSGSDQIAQFVASDQGKWAIAYDEFGYAKVYGTTASWIQNASGEWVQPYAENIAAALKGATLRPDLSQELSGVYASPDPLAYPISAYSYVVTQCARAGDRPSCKGPYPNPGVAETLGIWMRYIACEGQVNMARIGYSPLPPNLSQEVANSIARMKGTAPETLTADNCANPTFRGSLGSGASSPKDPLVDVASLGSGGGGSSGGGGDAGGGGGGSAAASGGDAAAASTGSGSSGAAAVNGKTRAVGGGSTSWRAVAPVAYARPSPPGPAPWTLVALVAVVLIPLAVAGGVSRRRDRRGGG